LKKIFHLVFIHAVEAPKSDELLEMVDGGEAGHSHVLPWQLLQLQLVLGFQHQVHLLVKPKQNGMDPLKFSCIPEHTSICATAPTTINDEVPGSSGFF
jgi:hypothetical protein